MSCCSDPMTRSVRTSDPCTTTDSPWYQGQPVSQTRMRYSKKSEKYR